jgi:hypothetical protein
VASSYWWKSKDLERLPEEPFLSFEIIDGELTVSRKLHLRHAAILGKLCAQVYNDEVLSDPAAVIARSAGTSPTLPTLDQNAPLCGLDLSH